MNGSIGDPAVADGPHTLGRRLRDRARVQAEATAIDDRGVRISYRRLDQRAHRLAAAFRAAGYAPGDRVATLSGNSIDHVVAFFACALAGIAFIPLSWRLTPAELCTILERADPQLLLVEDEYIGPAQDVLRRCERAPVEAKLGPTGVEGLVPARPARSGEAAGEAPLRRPVRDDDVALVIFTSGSEGAPKGVVLTHENCFWNNLALAEAIQLTRDDVVLATLPQFHIAAWNVQPLLAWSVGATVVLERSFQPDRVFSLIRERAVTAMMGVPTQYRMLADDPHFEASDLSGLRIAQVGGAPLPADLREAWATRGVDLLAGYGLTEAGPNVLSVLPGLAGADAGTVGRPYPHVEVRITDPRTGLVLQEPAQGELWVRGPSVFGGYLDDPDATARALSDGWLRTGDLAARDDSGRFRIVDRLKDIFISGGENIAPAEIERVLCAHPLVRAAAVVGVPDRVWGERGLAFVELVPGAACSADELLAHAAQHLAAYKLPVRIVTVDELPRAAIDKLARSRLVDRARTLTQEEDHEPAE